MGRRFRWRDGASVATSGSVGEQQLQSLSFAFSLVFNSSGKEKTYFAATGGGQQGNQERMRRRIVWVVGLLLLIDWK